MPSKLLSSIVASRRLPSPLAASLFMSNHQVPPGLGGPRGGLLGSGEESRQAGPVMGAPLPGSPPSLSVSKLEAWKGHPGHTPFTLVRVFCGFLAITRGPKLRRSQSGGFSAAELDHGGRILTVKYIYVGKPRPVRSEWPCPGEEKGMRRQVHCAGQAAIM